MVTAFQNTQVLLLAAVLLVACLAKLTVREEAAGAPDHVHGVPVPAGLARLTALRGSRGMTVGLGLGEGVLGLALLVTSHLSVRLATTVAFAAATWVVGELRVRRPDAGCGCFGGLSGKKVDRRSVLRAVLFTAAAVASLGAPLPGLHVLRDVEVQVGLVLAVELALFAALSPELPALFGRRGLPHGPGRPVMPCERRRSPIEETYATLYDSAAWLEHENIIASAVPLDVWREGCWRFVVFPARVDERDMEVVFAVSTAERDRTVRSAVVPPEPTGPDTPEPAGHDLPEPTGHDSPERAGHDLPETAGHDLPEPVGHDLPELAGRDVPEPVGHDAPGRAGHDLLETAGHDAPEQAEHDLPEPVGRDWPEPVGRYQPAPVSSSGNSSS